MNSCGPQNPIRRIASNYLWTPGGLLRNPLVTVASDGCVLSVERCDAPDGRAGVEFYAGVLSPGLVNAHCHLELSFLAHAIPEGCGFTDFACALRRLRAGFSPEERLQAAAAADAQMWSAGIQAVGDIANGISAFPVKERSRIVYRTFAELYGLHVVSAESLRPLLDYPCTSLTPHSTYSLQEAPFRVLAAEGETPLSIHFMETPGEKELFHRCGELWNWYEEQGLTCDFLQNGSPARRIVASVPCGRSVILVHNCCVEQEDIDIVTEHFISPVWWCLCPGSNRYISGLTPPVELLRNRGLPICLGTDSLASNRVLSIFGEMLLLRDVPLQELLLWATLNGARALGLEGRLGTVEPGKYPGLCLLSGLDYDAMMLTPQSQLLRIL